MQIETYFDKTTFTMTYVVWDEATKDAAIIDSVMDYDPKASKIDYTSADKVCEFVKGKELNVHLIMETHAHADHLSASQYLKKRYPQAEILIGAEITKVQEVFKELFNFKNLKTDGSQFDKLVSDGETFNAGSLQFKAIHTPGHTPACYCYQIEDVVFTGDAIFQPDFGTGRCDFPAGSAADLYDSITNKIYTLPDETRLLTGHDYQPGGRELQWESTVAEQKKNNIQLKGDTGKEEYIRFRTERDKTLNAPNILLQSVQVNIAAGDFPAKEDNGISYLKMPVR